MVLRRFVPLLPGSLLVALAGILVTQLFSLQEHGLEIVGHIDPGLPSVGLPDFAWSDFPALLGGSVGVMLVGFAEGLSLGGSSDPGLSPGTGDPPTAGPDAT